MIHHMADYHSNRRNAKTDFSGSKSHNLQRWSHAMTEKPKKSLDQVRAILRLKNYGNAAEQTYVGWIRCSILFQ
jgi:hypothetical protein